MLGLRLLALVIVSSSGLLAQTGRAEYFHDGILRARDATAFVTFPKLPAGFQFGAPRDSGAVRMLPIAWIDGKVSRGSILILLPPRSEISDPVKFGKEAASSLFKTGLKPVDSGKTFALPGGKGYSITLTKPADGGETDITDIISIADSGCVVVYMARALSKDQTNVMRPLLQKIATATLVGSKVPTLADRKPSVRVHGLYQGPYKVVGQGGYTVWFYFDSRGYLHQRSPSSEVELDMDLMNAFQPKNVGVYLVTGKVMQVQFPGEKPKNYNFSGNERAINMGEDACFRATGSANGLKLAGHYNSSSYISSTVNNQAFSYSRSSDYYFTKDGKFSYESFAGANSVTTDIPTGNVTNSVLTGSTKKPTSGRYEIKDDRLILTYSNGLRETTPIYSSINQGKIDPELLYIGGGTYLKD